MNNFARLAIAAAAVVVVAIVGYNLLPGGSGPGGPAATATPSPTLALSPPPEPTPATTFPALFSTHPGGGAPLAPGDWIITAVEPLSITLTIPEGWYKGLIEWAVFPFPEDAPSVAIMAVANLYVDPCDPTKGLLEEAPGPGVDDLVAAMSAVPGIDASAATDVTLGGFAGKSLELSRPATAEACSGGSEPSLWPVVGEANPDLVGAPAPAPGQTLRYWIIDVDGTRLVVALVDVGSTARATEAQAIVDSMRITP
ncbi:MAG: hypothetical protein EPO36_05395 [Chloroflexota bacterium]|nr:MAG: hypothetical protein EPO36_05395 [Chloroflexota bacterium]